MMSNSLVPAQNLAQIGRGNSLVPRKRDAVNRDSLGRIRVVCRSGEGLARRLTGRSQTAQPSLSQ